MLRLQDKLGLVEEVLKLHQYTVTSFRAQNGPTDPRTLEATKRASFRASFRLCMTIRHSRLLICHSLESPAHQQACIIPDILRFSAELNKDNVAATASGGGDQAAAASIRVTGLQAIALGHSAQQLICAF